MCVIRQSRERPSGLAACSATLSIGAPSESPTANSGRLRHKKTTHKSDLCPWFLLELKFRAIVSTVYSLCQLSPSYRRSGAKRIPRNWETAMRLSREAIQQWVPARRAAHSLGLRCWHAGYNTCLGRLRAQLPWSRRRLRPENIPLSDPLSKTSRWIPDPIYIRVSGIHSVGRCAAVRGLRIGSQDRRTSWAAAEISFSNS
jgi:hypothetical protein